MKFYEKISQKMQKLHPTFMIQYAFRVLNKGEKKKEAEK